MKAKELLFIMKRRLCMQEDGITNPSEDIKIYTRDIVKNLSEIDGEEELELFHSGQNFKCIRVLTKEVLAEHTTKNT